MCYASRVHGRFSACFGAFALWLCACGASQQGAGSYGENAKRDYDAAMESFEDDDCLTAEPAFRAIRSKYPYSSYAALAELREADCLSKQDKQAEAIQAYKRFARIRASHPEVPYARFRAAATRYEQIPEAWALSPPTHERDLQAVKDALRDLRKFLLDFPYDERTPEAQKMADAALKLLVEHELYVADFYLRDDEPAAAIVRLKALLKRYPGSGLEAEAMLLMGRTQLALRERSAAHDTFRRLMKAHPGTGLAKQAERYLVETGGSVKRKPAAGKAGPRAEPATPAAE